MQETPQNLAGKCAIVTGGSRGIGRAVVLELARRGANIVFSYAGNAAAAEETRASAAALGVEVRAVKANATDPAAAPALVDAAKELGGVDILVNNAGITRDKLAARMSAEDFEAVIATNLTGAFLMTKAVLRPMMRARAGAIVNLSSVVGLRGNAGQANYAASKAGLIGLTKSIAREVGRRRHPRERRRPRFYCDRHDRRDARGRPRGHPCPDPRRPPGCARGCGACHRVSRVRRRRLHHSRALRIDGGMSM